MERAVRDVHKVARDSDGLLLRTLTARCRQAHEGVHVVMAKALAAVDRGELTAADAAKIEARAYTITARINNNVTAAARAAIGRVAAREAPR